MLPALCCLVLLYVIKQCSHFNLISFLYLSDPNSPVSIRPYNDVTWPQYTAFQQMYLHITPDVTSASVKQAFSGPAVQLLLSHS